MKDIIKGCIAAFLILVVYSYAVAHNLLPPLSVIFVAQPASVGLPVAQVAAPVVHVNGVRVTAVQPTDAPAPTDMPPVPTTAPAVAQPTITQPTAAPIPTAPQPTAAPQPTPQPTATAYPAPVVADARPTPLPVVQAAQSDTQAQPQPQPRTSYTARLIDGENNGLVAAYTYNVCTVAGPQAGGATCELAGAHGVRDTLGGRCNAYWVDGDPGAQTFILTHAPLCTPGDAK